MGEREGTNNAGRAVERATIAEAAALLGCHPNTIRNRVKAGMYRAEKVHTENGPTWLIERDSLITNAPTSARQQGVRGVPTPQQEALQELARAIVREAGLQEDPERTARREGLKTQLDMLKHLTTLSGATVVAVVLIDAQLDLFFNATLVSVVSVGLAFWVALTCMIWLNFYVLESAVPNWLLSAVTYAIITSFFTLSIGVIVLVYNVMSLT